MSTLSTHLAMLWLATNRCTLNVDWSYAWLLRTWARNTASLRDLTGAAAAAAEVMFVFLWQVQGLGWLSLVSLLVYVAFFSLGWGPLPWLVTAEVLPVRAKSYGKSCFEI